MEHLIQAPSARMRISFNPQLFTSGFKNFPVHTQRIQVEFACPHASDGIRIQTSSAYHLNGIFGNSGANSNGTVHPGGKFSEKR